LVNKDRKVGENQWLEAKLILAIWGGFLQNQTVFMVFHNFWSKKTE
jgi:hypothetical protein